LGHFSIENPPNGSNSYFTQTLVDFEDYPEGSICKTPPLCFCCEKSKQNQIEQERKEKKGENSWILPIVNSVKSFVR
jgi:hypothetical protein